MKAWDEVEIMQNNNVLSQMKHNKKKQNLEVAYKNDQTHKLFNKQG